jgi:hypothetical protein
MLFDEILVMLGMFAITMAALALAILSVEWEEARKARKEGREPWHEPSH